MTTSDGQPPLLARSLVGDYKSASVHPFRRVGWPKTIARLLSNEAGTPHRRCSDRLLTSLVVFKAEKSPTTKDPCHLYLWLHGRWVGARRGDGLLGPVVQPRKDRLPRRPQLRRALPGRVVYRMIRNGPLGLLPLSRPVVESFILVYKVSQNDQTLLD
jgi:hypothetical protein